MTSFVKDSENAAAPTSPGAPARPQPIALEVPVIVNGARAVEGSDKREPFSEHSQTVLVFGHGAVIRVSAALAPGQLIFLTNEKTKKEVVCQVVKSKTDGNAVGYVELRFTEPAPGFWGMRFPSDTALPQAAPRPAGPPVVPAAPKAASPAPPVAPPAPSASIAPIAPKPIAPPPPIALKPVVPAPPAAPPELSTPAVPSVQLTPHSRASIFETPSVPVASTPVFTPVEAEPSFHTSPAPAASSTPTTEELKQQAARLQEQLSSLLFAETPKPATPDSLTAQASQSTVNLPEVAKQVFESATPAPESAPASTTKSVPPPSKLAPAPLEAEELKIPAWLAPLARETDSTPSAASPAPVETPAQVLEPLAPPPAEDTVRSEIEESSRRPETAVFGGQLLGEAAAAAEAPGSKSRTGLFIGIAAALLLVAGGVWYSQQPGSAISGMLGGISLGSHSPAAAQQAPSTAPVHSAQPSTVTPSAAISPAPAPVSPPTEAPAVPVPVSKTPPPSFSNNTNFTSTPVIHTPALTPNSKAATHATAEVVEEAKKPSLGEVHLATPKINNDRTASAPGESAPTIDVSQAANLPAPASTLSSSHRAEPVAPAPVGGDVKPAKLISSVAPVYPDMARTQRISGNVQIDALITEDGSVSTMKVLSGPPLLHQAALNAVKQWKFQPAELDGKATSMHLTVTVQFRTQ